MPVLVSVNVGLPQDIEWQGRTVRTAVFKQPVKGPVMARRLNLEGDGQGDLAGHGGEHRAVMVYQVQSYRYWETVLGRTLSDHGQFGENLTVDGLADDDVWIGDRYRIGGALFEVTQPRVTCYRVGIRLSEPRMPSLLVAHRRPGFYCRVIEEGVIAEGDPIILEARGDGMSVAEVDALLYLPERSEEKLRHAVGMRGLSEGWRGSFEALLKAGPERNGNAGLANVPDVPPAWAGFRDVRVLSVHEESPHVRSFVFGPVDGAPLPAPRAGQFLVLKIDRHDDGTTLLRSYSISDASHPGSYRISVKRAEGVGSAYLHDHVEVGSIVSISAPRGTFVLPDDERPLVLWGVGIGVTPLLAMLHDIVAQYSRCPRKIYWIYGTRDGSEHLFAQETRELLGRLDGVTSLVAFSHPRPGDRLGTDFDVTGRLRATDLVSLGIPSDARFLLCGPPLLHAGSTRWPARAGISGRLDTLRTLRVERIDGTWRGEHDRRSATPTDRPGGNRPIGVVRPQWPFRALGRPFPEPVGTRRGKRRARALVVPFRRLPQLRKRVDRWADPILPGSPPTACRRRGPHLLRHAVDGHRAGPVTIYGVPS